MDGLAAGHFASLRTWASLLMMIPEIPGGLEHSILHSVISVCAVAGWTGGVHGPGVHDEPNVQATDPDAGSLKDYESDYALATTSSLICRTLVVQ